MLISQGPGRNTRLCPKGLAERTQGRCVCRIVGSERSRPGRPDTCEVGAAKGAVATEGRGHTALLCTGKLSIGTPGSVHGLSCSAGQGGEAGFGSKQGSEKNESFFSISNQQDCCMGRAAASCYPAGLRLLGQKRRKLFCFFLLYLASTYYPFYPFFPPSFSPAHLPSSLLPSTPPLIPSFFPCLFSSFSSLLSSFFLFLSETPTSQI